MTPTIVIKGPRAAIDGQALDLPTAADPYRAAIWAIARTATEPVQATLVRDGRTSGIEIHPTGRVTPLDAPPESELPPPTAAGEAPTKRRTWLVLAAVGLAVTGTTAAAAHALTRDEAQAANAPNTPPAATSTLTLPQTTTAPAPQEPDAISVSTTVITSAPASTAVRTIAGSSGTHTVIQTVAGAGTTTTVTGPGGTVTQARYVPTTVYRTVAAPGPVRTVRSTQYVTRTVTATIKVGYRTPPPR